MRKLKKKSNISIIIVTILVLTLLLGLSGGYFLGRIVTKNKNEDTKNKDDNYVVKAKETESCSNKAKLYLKLKDKNIYTYCLDNVEITENKVTTELSDLIEKDSKMLEKFINSLKEKEQFKDGGSRLYQKNNLTVLACNKMSTKEGEKPNTDIYIGPTTMNYEDGFCEAHEDMEEFKRFTKTYQVLNVIESNDEAYQYLTVRQFQVEEVETVKVEKNLNKDIKEDAYYEFTFEITDKNPKDEIKSIFADTTLISIEKTDKTGLDQIQDSLYY